ncbi:MAG: 3-isopropylmalate dehydrogenase [Gammaproteobacteria bacterium]
MNKKIAVLAGDGIGPEVMTETLRILDVIAQKFHHQFEYIEGKIGGQAYDDHQTHCPKQTLQICQQADAILFGSVGGPVSEQQQPKWKNCEANSILKLRQHFNLNINIRPVVVYPELAQLCPLKSEISQQGIDCVIFRELTGGIYFGRHEQSVINGERQAFDDCTYREAQIQSIVRAAFKAAQSRCKKVCSVDKANVLATSKLWREIAEETSKEFPDVTLTHMLVDNCAMQLVIHPQQFDVIVTENLFGDIISDLAAALPGSLGLIPSASLNAQGLGLYEPSGGSAPDIAGKGIANPCAQILSAAWMLNLSFGMITEAKMIENAVKSTIASGIVTADLSKTKAVTTSAFVDAVIRHLDVPPTSRD